jgi:hypothetical protein
LTTAVVISPSVHSSRNERRSSNQEKWERNPEVSEIRILGESSIEQIDVPENELKKPVMKKYRIIIELTGDSPIVEANDAEEAEDHFVSEVTGDQLLQLLTISAEAIEL